MLYRLLQLLVVGLLLHFVLHTFVTFGLGRVGLDVLWLWKELVVVGMGGVVVLSWWKNMQHTGRGNCIALPVLDHSERWLLVGVVGTVIVGFLATIVWNDAGWGAWLYSVKYNVFVLVVFGVWYGVARGGLLENSGVIRVLRWLRVLLVVTLAGASMWYMILSVKPTVLRHIGYDPLVYEGQVGQAPPAVYRSQYDQGTARNQFVFERPISRGFYLVAFWPLFFVLLLQRRSLRQRWWLWVWYVLMVGVTFSRAARGAWLLQTVLLVVLTYWCFWGPFVRRRLWALLGGGVMLAFLGGGAVWYSGVLTRDFSDKGHVEALVQGVVMVWERPLVGWGGSSAGPGSHRMEPDVVDNEQLVATQSGSPAVVAANNAMGGFNPENQFLQVMIEYGVLGFGFWFLFWCVLLWRAWSGWIVIRDCPKKTWKKLGRDDRLLVWARVAIGVGLAGLLLEGMVLHSLGDRMVMYPFLAIAGVIFGCKKDPRLGGDDR